LKPETVAPRLLPDGLLEVRFAGSSEPVLVLVEIEADPDADADRQVLDDLRLFGSRSVRLRVRDGSEPMVDELCIVIAEFSRKPKKRVWCGLEVAIARKWSS